MPEEPELPGRAGRGEALPGRRAETWALLVLAAAGLLAGGLLVALRTLPERSTPLARESLRRPARLELNLATQEDLVALPGIGEVLARRILEYREAHGGFSSLRELLQVRGISRTNYERIEHLLTVAVPYDASPRQPKTGSYER